MKITDIKLERSVVPVKHQFVWRKGLPGSGTQHDVLKITVETDEGISGTSYAMHGGSVESVQVSNPTLSVDFANSTFATQLQLSGASLGQETFSASGTVTSSGIITSANGRQSLAGALSMDGRQAGYQFNKSVERGSVSGLTLWGR